MKTITANEFLMAARIQDICIVEKYIQKGLNINIQDKDGYTALMWVLSLSHKQVLRYYLMQGLMRIYEVKPVGLRLYVLH